MWHGIWSAGRGAGGGEDPERMRCVRADGARKRATKRYTNRELSPPPSLLRRETEEYDRRQALLRSSGSSAAGSSSGGASSSRAPLLMPVKREPEELPPLRTVKREPEEEAVEEPLRGHGVVGPEDYLVGPDADAFEAALAARTAREHEEEVARRRRDEEFNALLNEQGLAAVREFAAKQAAWRHEADEQAKIYIDLGSDEDED